MPPTLTVVIVAESLLLGDGLAAIFRKLDLTDRSQIDRRVTAAVVYLRSIAQPFA